MLPHTQLLRSLSRRSWKGLAAPSVMFIYTACLAPVGANQAPVSQPNIILVIADDLGWSQVSTGRTNLGNPSDFYETPALEVLAEEGMTFPHAYTAGANCAPTRASILTGQYASRPTNNVFAVHNLNRGGDNQPLIGPDQGVSLGVDDLREDEIPGDAFTIAEAMQAEGYFTAHFGKYHVGDSLPTNGPLAQGFDYNFGGTNTGAPQNYFALQTNNGEWEFNDTVDPSLDPYARPYTFEQSQILAGNGSLEGTPKHLSDAMTEAAVDFIDGHKSTPFFMHLSYHAIHSPFTTSNARPDLLAKFQNKTPSQIGHDSVGQAAIAEGLDQSIGQIVSYLKETADPRNPGKSLSETTLVYFLSDNGGAISSDDNGPLRGMKGTYREGGIRTATIVWSEGLLGRPGTIDMTPTLSIDLFPTFLEMASGAPANIDDIDGVSLWSLINSSDQVLEQRDLFWHFPGYLIDNRREQQPESIIRRGNYKLTYNYHSEDYTLYDVVRDISETNDLLRGSPDASITAIASDMSIALIDHLESLDAPMPTYRATGQTVAYPPVIERAAGAGFVPDPTKVYHIDNPALGLRLAATGVSQTLETRTLENSGPHTRWRFLPSETPGLWHIERANGGSTPRIRTVLTTTPDMQESSSSGVWTRFSITENPNNSGTYLLTLPLANTENQRLRIRRNGTTDFSTVNRMGRMPSFVFVEAR